MGSAQELVARSIACGVEHYCRIVVKSITTMCVCQSNSVRIPLIVGSATEVGVAGLGGTAVFEGGNTIWSSLTAYLLRGLRAEAHLGDRSGGGSNTPPCRPYTPAAPVGTPLVSPHPAEVEPSPKVCCLDLKDYSLSLQPARVQGSTYRAGGVGGTAVGALC